jgi:hypothetical protein
VEGPKRPIGIGRRVWLVSAVFRSVWPKQRQDFSSAEAFLVTFWATKSHKSVGILAIVFLLKIGTNLEYKTLIVNNLTVHTFFVLPQKRYPKKVKAAQKFYDSAA